MPCGLSFVSPAPERSGAGFLLGWQREQRLISRRNWHPATRCSKLGRFPQDCWPRTRIRWAAVLFFRVLSNMPIVRVTRRLHFSAGHRLHNPELSEAENREIYGMCNNPAGHGHNYGLEVTLKGEIDPKTGYVFDLKRLRRLVEGLVLKDVDHANLNVDVGWMKGVIPTAENIAVEIWRRLDAELPDGTLERVLVSESDRNFVEYFGD